MAAAAVLPAPHRSNPRPRLAVSRRACRSAFSFQLLCAKIFAGDFVPYHTGRVHGNDFIEVLFPRGSMRPEEIVRDKKEGPEEIPS
jgi:hypothetical protein